MTSITTQEHEQLHERLEAFAELLRPLATQEVVEFPRWVWVDDYFGRSFNSAGLFCHAHAQAFTAKYGGDIEADYHMPQMDGLDRCEVCWRALHISLTEYGVELELERWEASVLSATPSDHWDLLQLVLAVRHRGPFEIRVRVAALQSRLGLS